jgi:hypothetical protein
MKCNDNTKSLMYRLSLFFIDGALIKFYQLSIEAV